MNLLEFNALELPLNKQLFLKRYITGESQKKVAERLGITQEKVSDIERGKVAIPRKCHADLIRYLYQGMNEDE
ncbi:sigma factor-like helix-turn-helix DNA-binding protein [Bacillus cereus]|uniref:sigma factor-like helix-turn-helix DNA-binding protein n=1 Tax=Bacillus cereus TaxID=1396 RepID=UPI00203EDA7C|nr:helix-turn-helix transcriptional regulator [Bacillus cereus]MCM3200922.1 helix-turn-helix domain-containing protein [Bacillus cereus]